MDREALIYYSIKYRGNYGLIIKAIQKQEKYQISSSEYRAITILDEAYPECLKDLRYPPIVLFYSGDIGLLQEKKIGMIGSRILSEYGKKVTQWIVKELKEGVIVSGLAKGADGCAHLTAIEHGRKTIAVLGNGISVVYPKENVDLYEEMKRNHLIISEYPFDVKPQKHHFPWRNRIIAALSDPLIVTQAAYKSGTMITVDAALEMNREIWTVPYPIFEEGGRGCNALIENGAKMILQKEDLKGNY